MKLLFFLFAALSSTTLFNDLRCPFYQRGYRSILYDMNSYYGVSSINKGSFVYTSRGVAIIFLVLPDNRQITIVRQDISTPEGEQDFNWRLQLLNKVHRRGNFPYHMRCYKGRKFIYFVAVDREEYTILYNNVRDLEDNRLRGQLYRNIVLQIKMYNDLGFSPMMEDILHFRVRRNDITSPIDPTIDKFFRINENAHVRPIYITFPDVFPAFTDVVAGELMPSPNGHFECLQVRGWYNILVSLSLVHALEYFLKKDDEFTVGLSRYARRLKIKNIDKPRKWNQLFSLVQSIAAP